MNSLALQQTPRAGPPSKRLPAMMAIALLLSACANYKGIASGAQPRAAADYATAASLPAQGGNWPALDWVRAIGGAPLQALVDEALAGNPALHSAAARVAAARALADAAGAAELPSVGADFSSTYQRFSEHSLVPPPLAGQYKSDNQLALNFAYDFDFWGKHAAALRAAQAQGKAAEAEQYATRLLLTTAVARTWVQLARQSEQLALIERQQAVQEKIARLTQQRVAAGLDTQSDSQQNDLRLAGLRVERAQWQEAQALTRNQLAALLGQGPDRGLGIARASLPPAAPVALPDQLPLSLLGRRPDIVAARWQVEAAQGEIDNAKAQFYPDINLIAFAGFSSLGLSNLLQSGSRIAGVGPALRLPVFEGGALRAQLKGKVARYDGAVAGYNQTLTEALHEVADQVQSLRAAAGQSQDQQRATQAAAQTLKLAQQRQRVGTANLLPALAAESVWLQQRRLELDLQARSVDVRIALTKALGGGFDAAAQGLETGAPHGAAASQTHHSTFAQSAS